MRAALGTAVFTAVFGVGSLVRGGRRPTHTAGVAARGEVVFVAPFAGIGAGERGPAVARFASVLVPDDAACDIRGVGLSLELPSGRWDLAMNTGQVAFSSAADFLGLALLSGPKPWTGFEVDERGLEALMRASPRLRRQYADGLVRAPEALTALTWHSQVPARMGADLVRFRLAGTGTPGLDAADRDRPWSWRRRPGEARDPGYLADDLDRRLQGGGASWWLEAQRGSDPDPGAPWTGPWVRIARVTLERRLSFTEAEDLSFDIGRLPPGCEWPESRSLRDPASVVSVRRRVYAHSRRFRRRRSAGARLLATLRDGPTGMRHAPVASFLMRVGTFLLLDPWVRDRPLEDR